MKCSAKAKIRSVSEGEASLGGATAQLCIVAEEQGRVEQRLSTEMLGNGMAVNSSGIASQC